MKLPINIPVYGDITYRGSCPSENLEQITSISRIRGSYPDTYGMLIIHPKNEGVRSIYQSSKDKAMGLTPGASDLIIPGMPSFVCEIKRRDRTKSSWQPGQQEYLLAAIAAGSFACVALGADAVMEAFREWLQY